MPITIELAPELQAELTRQAEARGVGIDAYAAGLLEEAARVAVTSESPSRDVVEAVDRLMNFGKLHGLSLGGMTIRELRDEARP